MIQVQFGGQKVPFMVDTGATVSTINTLGEGVKLSSRSLSTVGFLGVTEKQKYTVPQTMRFGTQILTHQLLYAPKCPVNLLGHDLLTKLGISFCVVRTDCK